MTRRNSESTEELEDEDVEEDENEEKLKHLSKRIMVDDSEDESEINLDMKNQAQNNDKVIKFRNSII